MEERMMDRDRRLWKWERGDLWAVESRLFLKNQEIHVRAGSVGGARATRPVRLGLWVGAGGTGRWSRGSRKQV